MKLSEIKKQVVGASYLYHRDSNARLMSVQIGDLPFRLVRTLSEDGNSMKNYLVKTSDNYHNFSYADIKCGRVKTIDSFSLVNIKNSKERGRFSQRCAELIHWNDEDIGTSLEGFMNV